MIKYPPTRRAGESISALQKSIERANEILEIITAQRGAGQGSLTKLVADLSNKLDTVYTTLNDKIDKHIKRITAIEDTLVYVETERSNLNNASIQITVPIPADAIAIMTVNMRVPNNTGLVTSTTGINLLARDYPIVVDGVLFENWRVVDFICDVNLSGTGSPQVQAIPAHGTYHNTWDSLAAGDHTFRFTNPYAYDLNVRLTLEVFNKL